MHVLSTQAGLQQFVELLFAPPNQSGMKTAINSLTVYKPPGLLHMQFKAAILSPSLSLSGMECPLQQLGG